MLARPPSRPTAGQSQRPVSPLKFQATCKPMVRDLSLPPAVGGASRAEVEQGPFGTNRRAHSAQPPASPKRAEHLSPRRVVSHGQHSQAFSQKPAASGAPVPPAPVFLGSPRRVPIASTSQKATAGKAHTSSLSSIGSVEKEVASSTGAKKAALSSQLPHRPVRASSRKSIASASSPIPPLPLKPAAPALNPTQLAALTAKHTNFNKQHYNVHSVTVIHKDEDRPPSPSSKIRKTLDGSSSPKSKDKSDAILSSASEAGQQTNEQFSQSRKRPHSIAAGDDSPYESPVKPARGDGEDGAPDAKRSRTVKWDRGLLQPTSEVRTPRRAKAKAAELAKSKKVYKVSDLANNVASSV